MNMEFVGAGYAAGMSGRDMRRYATALAHDRSEMFRRVLAARAGSFATVLRQGFGATLLDAQKLCDKFLPEVVPEDFGALKIPLTVMASDLHRREAVAFSHGPLKPALAASIALPTLVRPVLIDDRILIDGGATNPLPFDQLRGRADVVVAVSEEVSVAVRVPVTVPATQANFGKSSGFNSLVINSISASVNGTKPQFFSHAWL